jgi:hypothetical protein
MLFEFLEIFLLVLLVIRGGHTSWDYGTIGFGILWNSLELFGIIFRIPQKFV